MIIRAQSTGRARSLSKENPVRHRPLGAVLVGGRSRRMGEDKALIEWLGRPLALHVADVLDRVCPQVVLVGGSGRGYERLGRAWLPDLAGVSGAGPMAGLITALRVAPRVLLVACDLPFLEPFILERLLTAAGQAPVAIPMLPGRRMDPLIGIYGRGALPLALRSLASGSGRMSDLIGVSGARVIPASALGSAGDVARALTNLNRQHDLAAARGRGGRADEARRLQPGQSRAEDLNPYGDRY